MNDPLLQRIHQVVRRFQARALRLNLVHALAWGIVAGAAVTLIVRGVSSISGHAGAGIHPLAVGAAVLAGGWTVWRGWTSRHGAAHRIDLGLSLKDRVVSALDFARLADPQAIHHLQIADTADHVASVNVDALLPWRWRRDASLLTVGVGLFLLSAVLPGARDASALPVPPAPPLLVDTAAELAEDIEELEEAFEGVEDERVEEVLEEVKALAETLKEPGQDAESALTTLGQMRTKLQQAARQLDVSQQEAMLAEMAEALQSHAGMKPVADALAEQDYREAAKQMEQAAKEAGENPEQFAEENAGLEETAAEMADQAAQAEWQKMQEAMKDLQEAMENQDGQACQSALQEQSEAMQQCAAKKQASQALKGQMEGMAKQRQALSQACRAGAGEQPGQGAGPKPGKAPGQGQGQSQDRSPDNQISQQDSDGYGLGQHENPFGDPTDMESFRQEEQVTGQLGQGPSMRQLEKAPEMTQFAGRDYQEVYSRYQKRSEEVIEQEEIPLSYQPIIKRYFEAIRPRAGEVEGEVEE